MKVYLSLFCIAITFIGFSQSISKQIIGTSGGTFQNGTTILTSTTGEIVVGSMTDEQGAYQLGNGYYPSLDVTTLSTEAPKLNLEVKIYPNPVIDAFFISHPEHSHFNLNITNLSGQLLYTGLHRKGQGFNMQSYVKGVYLITVSPKNSHQKNTYKIIKN